MYVIKNAFKSIVRGKVRNILIAIIIFVIAVSATIALSIKNSADKLIESYESSSKIEARLTLDRSSMRNDMRNGTKAENVQDFMAQIPELNMDMIKSYGDSEYVSSYNYTLETNLNSSNISKVTSEEENTPQNDRMGNFKMQENIGKIEGDFNITGYSNVEAMTEFLESKYKITEGNIFDINDENMPCVITDELAQANNITVGSTITLINPNNETELYTLNVVGIYSDTTESEEFSMFSQAANKIITNYITLNKICETSNKNTDTALKITTNATFNLVSKDVVERFSEELKTKGLSSYYTVTTNIDELEKEISPIKNLSTFATTFLIIVLLVGGIILIVINMINVRDRKYEIGVLRSIGMKKQKVLEQFVIEVFVITFIVLIIGGALGAILSVPIANKIASAESEKEEINQNFNMKSDKMNMDIGRGRKRK